MLEQDVNLLNEDPLKYTELVAEVEDSFILTTNNLN